jgi:hypothetical protein
MNMAEHNRLGKEFEEKVSAVLQLRGYVVEKDCTLDGTQIDLLARSQDALNDLEYLIECCSSKDPVGISLLKEKASILLNTDNRRRLLFVSLAGFTREAKDFAAAKEAIHLTTLEELERSLVDLRPYLHWIVQQFERSEGIFGEAQLFKNYIPLRCKDINGVEADLRSAVEDWLTNHETDLLFLLGEYGRGKTSFCRHFTYELCKNWQTNAATSNHPTPILVNLRDYRRSQNIEQIVTDTLLNRYGVRIASFAHFQRFCKAGRALLLLDGFDEMTESANPRHLKECFQQIYALSALGAKTIVTCRTNYFKSNQDVVDLLNSFSIKVADLLEGLSIPGELSFKGMARVLEICPLNDKQVFSYLQKRFETKADAVLTRLRKIHDLSDLSRRPVLLEMICETLQQLMGSSNSINSAALYECYTKRWTRRDGWRTTLDEESRQRFCEALAWLTHFAHMEALDYPLLHDAVKLGFSGAFESEGKLEVFLNDIQTCSFFVRTGSETKFRFAHQSFREFFVARRLVNDLAAGRWPSRQEVDDFLANPKGSRTKNAFMDALPRLKVPLECLGTLVPWPATNPWVDDVPIRRASLVERHLGQFCPSALAELVRLVEEKQAYERRTQAEKDNAYARTQSSLSAFAALFPRSITVQLVLLC